MCCVPEGCGRVIAGWRRPRRRWWCGIVQNATGAVTVIADRMDRLSMRVSSTSRDFR